MEQHHILKLLQKYEHIFDGASGEFNMYPISLHIIDKGVKWNSPVIVRTSLGTIPNNESIRLSIIIQFSTGYNLGWL
jgi:hypothetical protein